MTKTFLGKDVGGVVRAVLLSSKTGAMGRKLAIIERNGEAVPVRLVKRRRYEPVTVLNKAITVPNKAVTVPSDFEAFVSGYASVFNIGGSGVNRKALRAENEERRSKYQPVLSNGVING